MTPKDVKTVSDLLLYLEEHATAIFVRAQVEGGWGTFTLVELPYEERMLQTERFIEEFQQCRAVPPYIEGRMRGMNGKW